MMFFQQRALRPETRAAIDKDRVARGMKSRNRIFNELETISEAKCKFNTDGRIDAYLRRKGINRDEYSEGGRYNYWQKMWEGEL